MRWTFFTLLLSLFPMVAGESSFNTVSNSTLSQFPTTRMFDLDEFDDVITTYMRERKIPGASIAVSRSGQFLMRKGYGRASAQRLMTPWALMRIGSVSKLVTAIAVLHLCDQGRLDLDSKVFGPEGILSEHDVMSEGRDRLLLSITVRHLLQHTAGWDQRLTGDPLFQRDLVVVDPTKTNQTVEWNKETVVNFMLNQSLSYSPGTRYSYSNFGYTLLGLIVAKVSGESYEAFTRELLRSIGIYRMKIGQTLKKDADISEVDARAGVPPAFFCPPLLSLEPNWSTPYRTRGKILAVEYFSRYPSDRVQSVVDGSHLVSPPYGGFSMSLVDSSCGWIASASDLVRLLESLSHSSSGRVLLGNRTVEAMLARPGYANSSVWYGLGAVVEHEGRSYWHSGTLDGSTSIAAHDENGFTWSALVNCKINPNDLGDFMRHAIWRIFLDPRLPSGGGDDAPQDNTLNSVLGHGQGQGQVQGRRPNFVVDSISGDGKNMVKLMIPDYKLAEVLAGVSSRLYRLIWLDAYEELGHVFFNAVWTENDGGATRWRAYFDLTSSRYRKRYKARVAQGYRLSHVETYVSKRRLRYAAIFVKDDWLEWKAYEGVNPHRHKTEFFRLLREGFRLVVQSVTEYKGQVYVAAIYDKLYMGEIRVRLGLDLDEFTQELERQLANGRVLSYVQAYENRGQVKFSAVWSPRTTRYWAVSQSMTKYTLLNKLHEFAVVNVPLSCVTAYYEDEVLYFAALWR